MGVKSSLGKGLVLSAVMVLSLLVAPCFAADGVIGVASVIDGDTIEIHGERIRLFGIDAPESGQRCNDEAGKSYRCGQKAALALDALLQGKTVRCNGRGSDRYGRMLAVCTVGRKDINATMVDAGWAVAYVQYASDYTANEDRARAGRRGIWDGSFQMPWCFRHNTTTPDCFYGKDIQSRSGEFTPMSTSAGACPPARVAPSPGCEIKGNISKRGKIYHLPGTNGHLQTVIDPTKGERYFCSEVEAKACGWRPPR